MCFLFLLADYGWFLVGSGWLVPCVFCVVMALNGPYWFCCVFGILFVLVLGFWWRRFCGVVENGNFVIVFCATCLLLFLYCDFCVDVCIRIIDFFVSWCRVDVFLICVLCRCVGSLLFCVLDLCWCVSLVLWCKCVHSFYINNRLSILAWCDVDTFIAFFCGEYWVGCLMLFYQVSGHGLCLRLTDGCLFFVLFIFVSLLGLGFCGG